MAELYEHQIDAISQLLAGKHIIIAPTGVGKGAISMVYAAKRCEETGKDKILVVTTASKTRACFVGGTKVSTPNGDKNIEDIKKGDVVYSYNDNKGVVQRRVYDVLVKRNDKKIYRIDFDGSCNIIGTEDHPFYVGNGEYKRMSELRKGDIVYGIRSETGGSPKKTQRGNAKIFCELSESSVFDMWEENTKPNKGAKRPMVEKRHTDMFRQMPPCVKKDRKSKSIREKIHRTISHRCPMPGLWETLRILRYREKEKKLATQNRKVLLFERVFKKDSARGIETSERKRDPGTPSKNCKKSGTDSSKKRDGYKALTKRNMQGGWRRNGVCCCFRGHICEARCSNSCQKDWCRDRRTCSRMEEGANTRRRERRKIEEVRVDNIQVLRDRKYREGFVYCISVEETANFFANNLLVHNCDSQGRTDYELDLRRWCPSSPLLKSPSSLSVISWAKLSAWVNANWSSLEDYVFVFDEIAAVKAGVSSQRGKAFLKIAKQNPDWAGFTATPGESWLHHYPYFQASGLVRNKTAFMNEFAVVQTFKGYPEIVGWRNEDKLKDMWAKVSYAPDTRKVLSELPEQTHKVITFSRPKGYPTVLKTRQKLGSTDPDDFLDTTMGLCHYLRQLCFTKEKQEWIKDFVENLGDRLVVFYSYIEEGDKLEEICSKVLPKGSKIWRIDGRHHDIPSEATCGKRDVILCQWQSGSEGLNLQYISVWLSVSPTYSYSTSIQARGRVRRIGSKKPVFYYYLKCEDCIESDVYDALKHKQDFAVENWCISNNIIKEER